MEVRTYLSNFYRIVILATFYCNFQVGEKSPQTRVVQTQQNHPFVGSAIYIKWAARIDHKMLENTLKCILNELFFRFFLAWFIDRSPDIEQLDYGLEIYIAW